MSDRRHNNRCMGGSEEMAWVTRCLLVGSFVGSAAMSHGYSLDTLAANEPLQPGDFIVDTESPTCPLGGPIFRVTPGGLVSVIAQGGLLRKPRGNAILDDNTLIVADGLAGLLRVDLPTGNVSRIAVGPPWQPRDVVIDPQGSYIVVDWPEQSAAFLQQANSQNPPAGAQQSAGQPRPGPGRPPPGSQPGLGSPSGGPAGPPGGPPAGPPAVYRISPGGQVTVISQGGLLVNPHGVAIDALGNIIVADVEAGVVRVSPGGDQTLVVGAGRSSALGAAVDVRVDTDGSYVVADGPRGALVRVTPDGVISAIHRGPPFSSKTPQSQYGGPRGVVIEPDGDYVIVDEDSNSLFSTTVDGTVSTIYAGAPLCNPSDVTIYEPLIAPTAVPTPVDSGLRAPGLIFDGDED